MTTDYDAIVVGARCAGSPTAMLLARQGHRVLMVDRAAAPAAPTVADVDAALTWLAGLGAAAGAQPG